MTELTNLQSDSIFSGNKQDGKIQAISIGYQTLSGKTTWTSPMIIQNNSTFLPAVDVLAPTIHKLVRELVGFSFPVDTLNDISKKIIGPKKQILVSELKSKWVPFTGLTLKPLQGYSIALQEDLKIGYPKNTVLKLTPDTIAIDTGWQLIASPLPYPFADAKVDFEAGAISFFYSLSWVGSGLTAKANWAQVDSLKPFLGYAVYGFKKTNIVINPWRAFDPNVQLKKGSPIALHINFAGENGTNLRISAMEGPDLRPSPYLPFWSESSSLTWDKEAGMYTKGMVSLDSINETAVLNLQEPQIFKPIATGGKGNIFALWNERAETLTPMDGQHSIQFEAGENYLKIMAVSNAGIKSMEDKLKEGAQKRIVVKPVLYIGQGHGQIDFNVPPKYGRLDFLRVGIYEVNGKQLFESTLRDLLPGNHSIPINNMPNAPIYIQIKFTGQAGKDQITFKSMNTGN